MAILILDRRNDPHSSVVAEKIAARGGETILIDNDGGTQFTLLMDRWGRATIEVDRRDIGLVTRVWNRAKMMLELAASPEQRIEFLRRSEWSGAYRSIAEHFAGRVVNDPAAQSRCEQKTAQQRVAAHCGLPVPPTLVTNSRNAALRFAAAEGALICKSVGRPQLPYNQAPGGMASMVTCAVSEGDIAGFSEEEFARSATMLQRRIEKRWEYRVAALAGRLFAFRLYSQELEETKVDWRVRHDCLRHEPATLPETIEQRLLAFLDEFGLWQGQFDLIEDPDGHIWFVECNPNGQWLWLDEFVGGALSDWYAEALMAEAPETQSPSRDAEREKA